MINDIITTPVTAAVTAVAAGGIFSCCCDWKDCVDIVAMAAAVAGIAFSIFQESMLGVVGFLLLGVAGIVFHMINNDRLEQYEEQMAQVSADHVEKINQFTTQLTTQVASFDNNRKEMADQLQRFEADKAQRVVLQKKLEEERDILVKQNESLTKTNAAIEQNLRAMQASSQEIQKEVKELFSDNIQMAANVGLFDKAEDELAADKKQLEAAVASFQQEFNHDLQKLAAEIKKGSTLFKDILAALSSGSVNSQLKDDNAARAKLEQELKETQELMTKDREGIERDLASLKEAKGELEKLQIQIQAEEKASLERMAQTQKDEAKLIEKLEQMNNQLASQKRLVDTYDNTIAQKLQALQKVVEELKQKKSELKA